MMKTNRIAIVKIKDQSKAGSFFKSISPFNNRKDIPTRLFIIKNLLAYLLCNIGGMVIGTAIVVLIHYPLGKDPLKGEAFDGYLGLLFTMLNYFLPSLFVMFYWRVIGKKKLSEMYVKRGVYYFIGCFVGGLLVTLCAGLILLTGAVKVSGLTSHPDYLAIALNGGVWAFQSFHEEILCRGLAFSCLKGKLGVPAAFALSTAAFTIPHLSSMKGAGAVVTAAGIVNLMLISAIFTLIMLLTDSLWAACGAHFLWNFFLGNIFGLTVSGAVSESPALISAESVGRNVLNGGIFGIEASIITTMVLAAGTAVLFFAWRKKNMEKATVSA
ncbi:MAG: CPBP family intramembrane metalloprotease [Ruminococcus sp.]|uniref:CPBP family intramembrane glutamic endopeptidase n=1 Tax=Ruminococcus sp. TaxID=41978 RepID=UPI0025EF4146|nr:type II CAAX endopeptidase family protein [Ruminococcus sp.]MBO4867819.1 CPBP family intramembrane metalloprotease [Ruminococcus sp.]